MPGPRSRPFTLADAMILVATTALGLFLIRIAVSLNLFHVDTTRFNPPVAAYFLPVSMGVACILVGPSLAVLILTVCQPRRDRRHASRGPGFVACLVALAASVLPFAHFIANLLESHGSMENLDFYYFNLFVDLISHIGSMIIGAWLALLLVGRWRPRPTWTDRLGRAAGACWVFLYGFNQLYDNVVLPLLRWWRG